MKKTILLLAVFGLMLMMTACQKGEEVTISKYFEAMKVNDNDTLASMAIEPKDIEFKSFKIMSIEAPIVGPMQLPVLEKKLADLTEARKKEIEVHMDKKFALEEMQDQLDGTGRRDQKAELQKNIDLAQADLDGRKVTIVKLVQQINETKKMIGIEKTLIKASTTIDRNFELYTGETHLVKANVQITAIDGSTQDYVFMLRKNVLKLENNTRQGRLVITKIATTQEFEKEKQQKADEATVETQPVSEPTPAADTTGNQK